MTTLFSAARRQNCHSWRTPLTKVHDLSGKHHFGTSDRIALLHAMRFDVINLIDKRYEIRDGTGVGVGAPQFGPRRGLFFGISKSI